MVLQKNVALLLVCQLTVLSVLGVVCLIVAVYISVMLVNIITAVVCPNLKLSSFGSCVITGHVTIGHWMTYRWSFETITLSHMVAEILYVKDLAKHSSNKNVLILIFAFYGKTGFITFQLCVYSNSPDTWFELLTITVQAELVDMSVFRPSH